MKILGTGIDIVSVERIREKLKKSPALEKRLFGPEEIKYCSSKANSYESYAGRFAAKEAVYKVLSSYMENLYFPDIIITISGSKPCIDRSCRAGEYLSEKNLEHSLSISHEKEYAVASVLIWEAV